jgi:deoxyadenosine/deoxycytidine kinase
MRGFKSNTELVQSIFDGFREILKMTLLLREMILQGQFELLPDQLASRERKLESVRELLKEFEKRRGKIQNFSQIKEEIEALLNEILKIDTENADNIREKMREVAKELQELIERKKLLNYLR